MFSSLLAEPEARLRQYIKFIEQHEKMDVTKETELIEISLIELQDWINEQDYDEDFFDHVVNNPYTHIRDIQDAIQEIVLEDDEMMEGVVVSFVDAPPEIHMEIGGYLSQHTDKLVEIEGMVKVISDIHVIDTYRCYECKRCGTFTDVSADEETMEITEPVECSGCERQGPFKIKSDLTERMDYQLVQVDELAEDTDGRNMTTTMNVELIDKHRMDPTLSEGDRVRIVGRLMVKAEDNGDGEKGHNTHWIDATSIQPTESKINAEDISDEDKERVESLVKNNDVWSVLQSSIAPTLEGIEKHKEAAALALFADADHTGTVNQLYWGNPGEAKSDLMTEMEEIQPSSVVVDGPSASAVGLTASVNYLELQNSRTPYAKPGALSMANGGIAGIDEFDKMDDEIFNRLLYTLEKGEVKVVKDGLNTSLPARASVICTANPTGGRIDPYQPIAEQLGFPPYILSRFDLIQVFDKNNDRETLQNIMAKMMNEASGVELTADGCGDENMIDYDLLRKWIVFAQSNYKPTCTEDSQAGQFLLEKVPELIIMQDAKEEVGEDVESLPVDKRDMRTVTKIAQIIARINLCDEVSVEHAEKALEMKLDSMNSVGVETMALAKQDKDITQTEKAELVKAILNEDDYTREEVITEAHQEGLSPSETAHEIDKFDKCGQLWEKDSGVLKFLP